MSDVTAASIEQRGLRRREQSARDGLYAMAAADVGLIVFLLGTGQMRLVEGAWGLLLLVVAIVTFTCRDRLAAGSSRMCEANVGSAASGRRARSQSGSIQVTALPSRTVTPPWTMIPPKRVAAPAPSW